MKLLTKTPFLILVMLLSMPLSVSAQSDSANLSVGSGSGLPGASGITIPVSLASQGGTEVTGLNFDLNFDANQLTVQNVSAGSAASSANKSVSWASPSSGAVRVIVFGLNQTPIPNGTVATVTFNVKSSTSPGNSALSLSGATATDSDGGGISLSLSGGFFTVLAPPPTPTSIPASTDVLPAEPTNTNLPPVSNTATSNSQSMPTATETNQPTNTQKPTPANTSAQVGTITPDNSTIIPQPPTNSPISSNGTTAIPSVTSEPKQSSTSISIGQSASATSISLHAPNTTKVALLDPSDSLEVAAIATGTALALIDNHAGSTGTALASNMNTDQGSHDPQYDSTRLFNQLLSTGPLLAVIVFGSATALFVTSLTISFLRSKATFRRRSSQNLK